MECSRLKSECEIRLHPGDAEHARGNACLTIALIAVLVVSGCRLDMHLQPKYLPYAPTEFFHDGRSERQPVVGTVARGQLRLDELLYTGRENGVESNRFPFPITRADLERGREQYNVFCTPCHDYAGSGDGIIVRRGFPHPPSYHIDRLRNAPVGHFFDVMTNGFGTMYSYGSRIDPQDRWRIAAYVRALQLSQHATIDDVPANERPKFAAATGPGAVSNSANENAGATKAGPQSR